VRARRELTLTDLVEQGLVDLLGKPGTWSERLHRIEL
jgi:hypothetical protein